MIGECDPVGIPVLRMLAVTAVIVSYPYWWAQAAALADQITNTILSVPDVSRGLYKLMEYAVDGVALGGWQLIDLGLMGAIGLELIGLIFLKVVVILLGALLYATGPGHDRAGADPRRQRARARLGQRRGRAARCSGIAWATLFAVGALLIGDAGTAGPLIAGQQRAREPRRRAAARRRRAGEPVAVPEGRTRGRRAAAPAALRAARPRRPAQHALARRRRASARRTTGQSLREYGSRLARAAGAAGGELALAGSGRRRSRSRRPRRWLCRASRD